MTIREHFQRSQKRLSYGLVAVTIPVVLIALWLFPQAPRWQFAIGGAAFGLPAGLVVGFIVNRIYVCPGCGASFRKIRVQQMGRFRFDKRLYTELWDKCPQCGLSFDDPWPE